MRWRETERVYDELLVALVQSGDRRAAERLVVRWQPRLLRTASRLLRDDELARDAVQEAWAAIFRGCGRLRDPARFPGWAFGILHRKVVDRIRDVRRRRAAVAAFERAPAAGASGCEDRIIVDQALAGLSPEHRAAAILYFGEGLTLAEIADATSVPVGTVKSRLFHARRRLKAALTGDEDERD